MHPAHELSVTGLLGVAQDDAAHIRSITQLVFDTERYHLARAHSISTEIRRKLEAVTKTRWNVAVGTTVALTAYHTRYLILRDRLTGLTVICWN